jgi:hypothetical protein
MSTHNSEQAKSASQIVAEARQTMPEITVAQAKEELVTQSLPVVQL